MRCVRPILILLACAFAAPAYAQSGAALGASGGLLPTSTGALQLVEDFDEIDIIDAAEEIPEEEALPPAWVDVAKVIDTLRIPEKLADLRAVTTDASGRNYGFFFASGNKKTLAVYRNGRLMKKADVESIVDLGKPIVFRMTASGDLLYTLHSTDLYVNSAAVSEDQYAFSAVSAVHDEGGVLTFPEGGNVVTYDIHTNAKKTLYRHEGEVLFLRRAGKKVAYTVKERGFVRMYRNGRRVSTKGVENPHNFAMNAAGDVFYFTKAPRGYALYRNNRSYVTGKGAGAYVDVDPAGAVWHVSYTRTNEKTAVRLQKDRSRRNLLPPGTANVELFLAFHDGEYLMRAAFADQPSHFQLVRDGEGSGEKFLFEYPYNDTHGIALLGDSAVLRAYDDGRWRLHQDGERVSHPALRNVWFYRVHGGQLTVYATK